MTTEITTANAPATLLASEVQQLAIALPPAHAKFWLQIGVGQTTLAATLQGIEARYTGKVAELQAREGETPEAYQKRLNEGLPELRKLWQEAEGARKGYTFHLDEAKDRCMKVERLLSPLTNADYLALASKELELRKALATAAEAGAALERERVAFRLHFVNEFDRLASELRLAVGTVVSVAYKQALSTKMPVDGIPEWIKEHESVIAATLPGDPVPFKRILLTPEDATAIYNGIAKVPVADIRRQAVEALHEKFSTYASDLANAEAAIQHETKEFEATIVEAAQATETQAAVNTILATSQSFAAVTGPVVKVKEAIDCKGLTIPEATAIQAAFLMHGERAWVRVKAAPEKLTVAQQAAALDAIEVRVNGVRYRRDEK